MIYRDSFQFLLEVLLDFLLYNALDDSIISNQLINTINSKQLTTSIRTITKTGAQVVQAAIQMSKSMATSTMISVAR
jgi:hypothetical protein